MRDNDPDVGKYQLRTANADGSNEKMFFGGPAREASRFLAWMPNGSLVWDPLESTCRHASLSIL